MTADVGPAPLPDADRHADDGVSRRWWVLVTVALAQLMVVLDSTVVNVALPTAQSDLGFSNADRQWVITAYSLAFGSLLLLGGRVSDMVGRKRAFLLGLAGFAGASAVAGAAGDFTVLVTARVVQGVAGALLAPTALSVLTTTFTVPRERSRAFAVFSGVSGAGAAVGLLLGGLLTQDLSWRWTLYINVIIAGAAAAGAAVFLPRSAQSESRQPLDTPGALLGASGLFGLVFGFGRAETSGWHDPSCWVPLVLAVVLLAGFVTRQRFATHPLLPLSVVADRNRGASFLAVMLANVGMFGALLFVTYYVQGTLGYSPIRTGLAFLPLIAMLIVSAQLASILTLPHLGPKMVVPLGMVIAALGMALLTQLSVTSSYLGGILPGLILVGFGLGQITTTAIQTATLGVGPEHAGVSSATVNTSQQVGGAIGIALLSTLALAATARYAADHQPVTGAVRQAANLHGFTTAYWGGAGAYTLGAILAALLYTSNRRSDGVRQSGGLPATHGRISEQGRSWARGMLAEAAFSAARTPGPLRAFYEWVKARRRLHPPAVPAARAAARPRPARPAGPRRRGRHRAQRAGHPAQLAGARRVRAANSTQRTAAAM